MAARRRWIAFAPAMIMLPACLHLDSPPYATQPDPTPHSQIPAEPSPKSQFAELPSRPGVVILTNPTDKDQVVQQLPDLPLDPLPDTNDIKVVAGSSAGQRPAPESPLLSALRAHEDGKPDRSIEFLALLDRPNQELVLAMLPVLTRGASLDMRDPVATAVLTDQIRSAASRIESGAALKMDAVVLCSKVVGYGMYEPWPKNLPYKPNQIAQLYIEVRNMVCQAAVGRNGEGYVIPYVTLAEVRDASGKLVDQPDPNHLPQLTSVVEDKRERYCRTPIHDFHILYQFQAPSTPGVYTISVTVQDPITKRSVKTGLIQFLVGGA